ncbi:uncharacterized protein FOMMEDRAFT_16161 [Fomitiporia mediterranea MF3/22]|uniref:uncharacterized protein n=1 Tax=Fomitiporia mediterranea (strain MF3/22) TaxID=694068 RepID=UPI00044091E5|nr:uncharacterized protein FOMMEDRAFT_16161 [Fomitiporia mediterranea MF3/22]EJD07502.1 hypothetical protein FOMMEDRAFT_16161 [Fomitiporia mediterranea MF3/22]
MPLKPTCVFKAVLIWVSHSKALGIAYVCARTRPPRRHMLHAAHLHIKKWNTDMIICYGTLQSKGFPEHILRRLEANEEDQGLNGDSRVREMYTEAVP